MLTGISFFRFPLSVMNNYQAAGFGPPASPHTTTTRTSFPPANSPGPAMDIYSSNGGDGYVQAASPQPSGYPAIAVSRAPLNYSPVSMPPATVQNCVRSYSCPIPLLPSMISG